MRRDALAVTSDIFAQAGVEIAWIECGGLDVPPACTGVLAPGEMVLRINRDPHRMHHILGAALVQPDGPNVMATVYAPAIAERSTKTGVPMATLVGRVAAHEIGHLVLGKNSHSPVGLMRAWWKINRVDPTHWRFTGEDVVALQRRVLARAPSRAASGRVAN